MTERSRAEPPIQWGPVVVVVVQEFGAGRLPETPAAEYVVVSVIGLFGLSKIGWLLWLRICDWQIN